MVAGMLPLRIIKIGGSLLDLVELPQRLAAWREKQTLALDVLIPGGGAFAEAVRQADRVHKLGDVASHDLAIASMSTSARLLAHLVPDAHRVERFYDVAPLAREDYRRPIILDVAGMLAGPCVARRTGSFASFVGRNERLAGRGSRPRRCVPMNWSS